jgi:hypothetical protein
MTISLAFLAPSLGDRSITSTSIYTALSVELVQGLLEGLMRTGGGQNAGATPPNARRGASGLFVGFSVDRGLDLVPARTMQPLSKAGEIA